MTTTMPSLFSGMRGTSEKRKSRGSSSSTSTFDSPWSEPESARGNDDPRVMSWMSPYEVVSSAPDMAEAIAGKELPSTETLVAQQHDMAPLSSSEMTSCEANEGDDDGPSSVSAMSTSQPWLVTFWYAVWAFTITLGLALVVLAVVMR